MFLLTRQLTGAGNDVVTSRWFPGTPAPVPSAMRVITRAGGQGGPLKERATRDRSLPGATRGALQGTDVIVTSHLMLAPRWAVRRARL